MIPEPDDDGDAIVVADDEAIFFFSKANHRDSERERERESIGVVEICTLSTEFFGEDRECSRVVAAMRGRR